MFSFCRNLRQFPLPSSFYDLIVTTQDVSRIQHRWSLLCVISASQELSAQDCFSFNEVGPPCSRHVLFQGEGLGRSRKDPPKSVSWPKMPKYKRNGCISWHPWMRIPKNLHDVMFLCHCRAALCPMRWAYYNTIYSQDHASAGFAKTDTVQF